MSGSARDRLLTSSLGDAATTGMRAVLVVSDAAVVRWCAGDCWLLAAMSSLCQYPGLLHRVVPQSEQGFTTQVGYCGAFRFNFWVFGKWTEVTKSRVFQNSECGKTEINGESTFVVWPTLGARMAKEQNRACNLSLIASFLTLLFHKAVWQHVPGVVGFVMTSLLQIYQGILQ